MNSKATKFANVNGKEVLATILAIRVRFTLALVYGMNVNQVAYAVPQLYILLANIYSKDILLANIYSKGA